MDATYGLAYLAVVISAELCGGRHPTLRPDRLWYFE
jgi:hypothetical protein